MTQNIPQQSKNFLSPAGLADYLEIPIATVYAWRHSGTGPPGAAVGRHVRYRVSDVDRWIEEQTSSKSASAG